MDEEEPVYDVASFVSHRMFETGDPASILMKDIKLPYQEVCVRFTGFGSEEDEWINVKKHVRQRSLPCEAAECVVVLPGDLILCFQEGKEQALYFDAHVLDVQRRRHDVRGCRCRFLVRYDHDQSEEIVPLRKICRRPETDYRLQLLHSSKNLPTSDLKAAIHHSKDSPFLSSSRDFHSNVPKPKKQDKLVDTLVDGSAAGRAEKESSAADNSAPVASAEKDLADCEASVDGDNKLAVDDHEKS
ncbi:SAWADEE HOMEODOMAIN-like protein 2 [Nymphaea thermarum]|nr:SAWADEE HOMEODOMAIN-like protein 2 [Nymphaea thermarum]